MALELSTRSGRTGHGPSAQLSYRLGQNLTNIGHDAVQRVVVGNRLTPRRSRAAAGPQIEVGFTLAPRCVFGRRFRNGQGLAAVLAGDEARQRSRCPRRPGRQRPIAAQQAIDLGRRLTANDGGMGIAQHLAILVLQVAPVDRVGQPASPRRHRNALAPFTVNEPYRAAQGAVEQKLIDQGGDHRSGGAIDQVAPLAPAVAVGGLARGR